MAGPMLPVQALEEVDADTVGGYVTSALGKIARVGDRFSLDTYKGRVIEMQGRRVARVLLSPGKKHATSEQPAA